MRSRIARLLAAFALASATASAVAANTGVTVTLNPPPPLGVGDDTTFIIDAKPGDIPFLIYSRFPGPTTVPFAGQLDIGTPFFVLPVPVVPASGQVQFPCPLPCVFTGPAYSYVLTFDPVGPVTLTGVSQQIVLTVDPGLVDDCNGNLIDDDCEVETGATDCDGDGLIDDCEEDCDMNGTPDECESFPDCDGNQVPDGCQPDCDGDGVPDSCEPDCDGDNVPDDCEDDCDADGIPDDCEGCNAGLSVEWTMENCLAGADADFFDELTSSTNGGCGNVIVIGSTLGGEEHSCSDDAVTGNGGESICLIARPQNDFDPTDPKTLRFSVTVLENGGQTARLDTLSLWTLSPQVGIVSTPTSSSSFANCPPNFYGIRILRDGTEVYLNTGITLSDMWRFDSFDLSGDPNFQVANTGAVFDFEILAYDPPCTAPFRVWDLDEIKVDICCDAVGGAAPPSSCP